MMLPTFTCKFGLNNFSYSSAIGLISWIIQFTQFNSEPLIPQLIGDSNAELIGYATKILGLATCIIDTVVCLYRSFNLHRSPLDNIKFVFPNVDGKARVCCVQKISQVLATQMTNLKIEPGILEIGSLEQLCSESLAKELLF